MNKITMGLAMFCGVAVSAQASSSVIVSQYIDEGNPITSPISSSFFALSADVGSPLSQSFSFHLGSGQTMTWAAGFLNIKGTEDTLLNSATLTVSGPSGATSLWSANSGNVDWKVNPISYVVTSQFSGWTKEVFTAGAEGTYTFTLYDVNLGLSGSTVLQSEENKFNCVAFFAPVPDPSSNVSVVLVGMLATAGFLRQNRRQQNVTSKTT